MNNCKRHRFPSDIISYTVWLYYRFNLSHRDIEDLLAERGILVTRESIRLGCNKFGALYARRPKKKHRGYGDTFYIDEVFAGVPDHSAFPSPTDTSPRRQSTSLSQRFLSTHAAVQNLFNLVRHLVRAEHYRNPRVSAFADWSRAVA